jgi:hypothetical protein
VGRRAADPTRPSSSAGFDEGAEAHDPGDLAQVEGPDLDLAGQARSTGRLPSVLAGDGRDLTLPSSRVDLGLVSSDCGSSICPCR